MRTTQRDRDGTITFSALVTDAATGSGVATSGVPYAMARSSTGTYYIRFDPRLVPISFNVNPLAAGATTSAKEALAGYILTELTVSNTAALFNGSFRFTCTAIDRRT